MRKALLTVESVRDFIREALRRDRIFDSEQLMEYYGMTIHFYKKFCKMGMPFYRNGRKRYFHLSEVQKWFNENKIEDFML